MTSRTRSIKALLALLVLAFASSIAAQTPADADAVKRGEYVLGAAGCVACHTNPGDKKQKGDGKGKAAPLAGGRALETPFGTFYSPNITPDKQHGIGTWSADDFWRALSEGEGPGGVHYYPVFPFPSYAAMRRADADDLYQYLMSVPPQAVQNREHELAWYVSWRFSNRVWKWLFFNTKTFTDSPGKSAQWNRGAYLVNALGHCGECHTPRAAHGVVQRELHLSGNPNGPEGEAVPGIRSDTEDGIRNWSEGEIATYLKSGEDPDFDFAGGAMVEVIDDSTALLTDLDRKAIAHYLKNLPPLEK